MCGRYTLRKDPERLRERFDLRAAPAWRARFNIAPAQAVPIVVAHANGGREWALALWGLRPAWLGAGEHRGRGDGREHREMERAGLELGAGSPRGRAGGPLPPPEKAGQPAGAGSAERGWINARGETVAAKPAFRAAFRQRRCLLPADGFYEWRQEGGGRRPSLFQRREGEMFAFAGLWEPMEAAGGAGRSCAIVTTRANALVAGWHERMPVILRREAYEDWLAADTQRAAALLEPFPAEEMEAREAVAQWVNSARYDGPNCLGPGDGGTAGLGGG